MVSLQRIGVYDWLEQYEWHNNLVLSEESSVPKILNKIFENAVHGVLSNLKYFEKSRVLKDNKNLVWRQFYFSGPLTALCIEEKEKNVGVLDDQSSEIYF